ncbi:MAG TPA: hypothetical protein VFU88_17285 [Ktedonobacterales bacterium]|nr:hypothetical protein [Ktedonobacterales bacterium]
MRNRLSQWSGWDDGGDQDDEGGFDGYGYDHAPPDGRYDATGYDAGGYYEDEQYAGAPGGYAGGYGEAEGEELGLILQPEQSLVGVSNTVTKHGVPLLSYTRTMQRFYTSRKQRLSLGRFKCEVCGERIRFWAWVTPNKNHTHDGCYERLAWTWTSLYAQQQQLASQGQLE